jgi:signal peptidase I
MLFRKFLRRLWREWVRPLALPFLFIMAAKSALADINYVPTGSMKPSILEGDVVFINKLAYDLRVPFTYVRLAEWSEPQRGDIVVCFSPVDDLRLVKRVTAVPGDTVEVRNRRLILNGVPQRYAPLEPAVTRQLSPAEQAAGTFAREQLDAHSHPVMGLPTASGFGNFGPVRVPAGHYFMLGDNRDNSQDSRFFGFMPRQRIIGEAVGTAASLNLDTWRPRWNRFFSALE